MVVYHLILINLNVKMLLNKFQTKKLQILPKTIKSIYFTKMDADADLAISRIPLFLFVCTSLMTNN